MEATEQISEQQVVTSKKQVVAQMSVGNWLLTFLLLAIPLVNIIMLFIWAFDSSSTRRNFARAQLIIFIIVFVLSIGITILIFMLGMSSGLFSNFQFS